MMATLLLVLALLEGGSTYVAPAPGAYGTPMALETPTLGDRPAEATIALTQVMTHYAFLPTIVGPPPACAPIPGVVYETLVVGGDPTDRPAEAHADLNLALRGYEVTEAYPGLVDYGGGGDPGAPQLYTLFADERVPAFPAVYQVYDWDWECNCRGDLLEDPEVTLAGMGVSAGEVLHLPDSGYEIGEGYEALVLYASEERITLKYTRDDNVIEGYTIHVENVCVEPSLLALYRMWNEAGRAELPALRGGQPFGRARGEEIGVAIRDWGRFMDPRSRGCWWE